MTDIHETAEYLRRMGEPEASVEYITSRRPESVSLLETLGEALRPTLLNPPAANTGD